MVQLQDQPNNIFHAAMDSDVCHHAALTVRSHGLSVVSVQSEALLCVLRQGHEPDVRDPSFGFSSLHVAAAHNSVQIPNTLLFVHRIHLRTII